MTITREPFSSRDDAPEVLRQILSGEIEALARTKMDQHCMITGWQLFLLEGKAPVESPDYGIPEWQQVQPASKLEFLAEVQYQIPMRGKPMDEWERGTVEVSLQVKRLCP